MPKLFIDEVDKEITDEAGEYVGTESEWILKEWQPNGKARLVDRYENEDDANDEWFDRTYKFDFLPDDQRDTSYYDTKEEAEKELSERQQYE